MRHPNVICDFFDGAWADSFEAPEVVEGSEQAVGFTFGDDLAGGRWSYSGNHLKVGQSRLVDIDLHLGCEIMQLLGDVARHRIIQPNNGGPQVCGECDRND